VVNSPYLVADVDTAVDSGSGCDLIAFLFNVKNRTVNNNEQLKTKKTKN
jgi:hypothetical protein